MIGQDLLTASAIVKEEFVLETLTPLFMHGNRKKLEVRVPSIKGVLRYWWRTLQDLPSEELFKKEMDQFGGINKEEGRRSSVRFQLEHSKTNFVSAPILPHRMNDRDKVFCSAIDTRQTLRLFMVHLKRDAESPGEGGLTLKEEHSLYMRWMLLLSGFGQRARRGAGAVQYKGFQWQSVTDIQKTLREILEKLKRDDIFEFPPPEEGLLLRRKEKPKNKHPQINAVWVGEPDSVAENIRTRISRAGKEVVKSQKYNIPNIFLHCAEKTGKKFKPKNEFKGSVLGSSSPRFASPLHCTVRRVGQNYVPIVTEVASCHMEVPKYLEARNLFLRKLGVNT